MRREILFELSSPYRDDFRIRGYHFGKGEKAACIVGAMRGNEIQQVYIAGQLIKKLKQLEKEGKIVEGKSILVVPSLNPFSMNIGKRFWAQDNTDINRMFPGYNLGETTQRIAAGAFEQIKDYKIGIQFASFYISGDFIPHVRMMKTGHENIDMAKDFSMPYVVVREPRPFDSTTLNYNWQIWDCNAFSVYAKDTEKIDEEAARLTIESVLTFLGRQGIIEYEASVTRESIVVGEENLFNIKAVRGGLFRPLVEVGEEVKAGQPMAEVIAPYEGEVIETLTSEKDGRVFFIQDAPFILEKTLAFKMFEE
ncbi:MAG: succinylglutamate desuccinylase/aspartoacylase family protein [Clostridiales bacterium]|nr:succinylglutamate desuccinylase/aspartoacylase family protein [Clostridiales bacterium]